MTRMRAYLAALLCVIVLCAPCPARAQAPAVPATNRTPEEHVLSEAFASLGWPGTVTVRRLMSRPLDEDTVWALWPLTRASGLILRYKYSGTNGGSDKDDTLQTAGILPVGTTGATLYLDRLQQNGFTRGNYQGRPAAYLRAGDQVCKTTGLMELVRQAVNQAMSKLLFGIDTRDNCITVDTGTLAFSCGSRVFLARDSTGQGAEERIGQAMYAAAESQGLCAVGDTLVILAQTAEMAGTKTVFDMQLMAESVTRYYEHNAYGRVSYAYTFLDQDGEAGANDWFSIEGQQADYRGREAAYAIAALQAAFRDGAPTGMDPLERVIVVHPGFARQTLAGQGTPGPLETLTQLPGPRPWHEITVGPAARKSTLYARALILVAENDRLGPWAHEMGHSLHGRYLINGRDYAIDDRYNSQRPYSQNGNVSAWGLMCMGAWWGVPPGDTPGHMIGFTKESAGWLTYGQTVLGQEQRLSALETSATGSTLRIDDPTSADPESYMLLEARQSGGPFGAPESGVVAYLVSWDSQNKHHVVNSMESPRGATHATSSAAVMSYERPTLRDVGLPDEVTEAAIVPWRLQVTLHSEGTDDNYWAVVSTTPFTPTGLVGATISPVAVAAPRTDGMVLLNDIGPLPDIDLHAWDDQGRHVGLNYSSGEYERQIPGTEASGDLRGDDEWIYVPEGTQVRYAVSADKTRQFLQAHPDLAAGALPQEYTISYGRFNAQGIQTVADGGEGVVPAGLESPLSSPYHPSLEWEPAPPWHYGRNWPENLLLLGFMAGILSAGAVGGIVALLRR